jgi:hypothetical protein
MSFQAYIDNIKAKTGKTPERGPSRDAELSRAVADLRASNKTIEFWTFSSGDT